MATKAEIDAAVQTLLRGGDATQVYYIAGDNQSNCLSLMQTAGVIPKLVELVRRGTGRENSALLALCQFTECKLVEAQDAIAHSRDGAIFKWLVGTQDHGCPDEKQHLLTQLTSNHPVNQARLAVARGDFKPLVGLIKTSVASGDSSAIAKATNAVRTLVKPKKFASFSQRGGVAALEMVINWIPKVWDEHCFKAQECAFMALTKIQGSKYLQESPTALIRALEQNTTGDIDGSARKCLAVYKLTVMSEIKALAIVQDGGVAALVSILQSEALDGKDGQCVSERLWEYAIRLLTELLEANANIPIAHLDVIPVLLDLLQFGDLVGEIDMLLLQALETISRNPKCLILIHDQRVIARIVEVLERFDDKKEIETDTDTETEKALACTLRLLANLAFQNPQHRSMMVNSGAGDSVLNIFCYTRSDKLKTAAAMALRNLMSRDAEGDDAAATEVEYLSAVPVLIDMVKSGKSMKQREVAAAVLGNLARELLSQKAIVKLGGVTALVVFAQDASRPRQLEVAAMALWVFVCNNAERRRALVASGGDQVIKAAIQRQKNARKMIPWAVRLLAILK